MSATKRRGSSTGGKKKKALAEVPERAPVAKRKMAAFFDREASPKDAADESLKTAEKSLLPETEKHLKRVAVKVQVSKLPPEPMAEKPVSVAEGTKTEIPKVAETSPETVGKQNIEQDNRNENNLVKGGKIMSEQEQVVQQTESGGSNLVGFVALFAAIAALALVWFYASTSTGSPSVLSALQKSKVTMVEKIDALDAKVDALEAKMVAAEKEKLAKSVNSSMEALDKLAANADPKTAAMLKKMKAEMEKMVTEVK
ncbi:MAG: hypothetical protein GWP07_06730 [Xanthomonadaceae bacterium]|nr:hypothetical protein [Xanthomonadaceae bacterium]